MKAVVLLAIALCIESSRSFSTIPYKVKEMNNQSIWGPQPRIYNGNLAKEGQFPYMILMTRKSRFGFSSCSASLVGPALVLTAAHCFPRHKFRIEDIIFVGGKADLSDYFKKKSTKQKYEEADEKALGVQERQAAEIKIHPYYDPDLVYHDIAYVTLNRPFNLSSIKVIPISKEKMKNPTQCTSLGWGLTEHLIDQRLRYIEVEIGTSDECIIINAGPLLCSLEGGKGFCQGDSGGPLVCHNEVWGIAAFYIGAQHTTECEQAIENYYTEIFGNLDWSKRWSGGNPSTVATFKNIIVLAGFGYLLKNSMYIYNT